MKSKHTVRYALMMSLMAAALLTGVAFAFTVVYPRVSSIHFGVVASHPRVSKVIRPAIARPVAAPKRLAAVLPARKAILVKAAGKISQSDDPAKSQVSTGGLFQTDPVIRKSHTAANPNLASNTVEIDEPVQTYDTMAPPPNFVDVFSTLTTSQLSAANIASANLVSSNMMPTYTKDGEFLVFSANLSPDGFFHLWIMPVAGGVPVQLTTGTSNEFYPALNASNGEIAFTSDVAAGPGGIQNLYTIPFNESSPAVTSMASLTSLTIRTDVVTNFSNVTHPTWSPDNQRIAFSALTTGGSSNNGNNHYHIYYLFTSTDGYLQSSNGVPPAALTDGPAGDTNPAWAPDGSYIAFASTATAMSDPSPVPTPSPTTPVTITSSAGNMRSIWDIGTGQYTPFGAVGTVSSNGHITNGLSDDVEPTWAPLGAGNFSGDIAFSRGASELSPHTIFYVNAVQYNDQLQSTLGLQNQEGFNNASVQLNTGNSTATFNDEYPTWQPRATVSQANVGLIAYDSNRSVTYNDPSTGAPSETPINLPQGQDGIGGQYSGILQSELATLDPPTLLRFDSGEVIHINEGATPILPSSTNTSGSAVRNPVTAGSPLTFSVRLSDREALVDGNNVYVQIKNPNSQYQDSQGLEHKVYTEDQEYYTFRNLPVPTSTILYNGGDDNQQLEFNQTANGDTYRGAAGGFLGANPISVGQTDPAAATGSTTNNTNGDTYADAFFEVNGSWALMPDPNSFVPQGQEFECQVVNPSFAGGNTTSADYVNPHYLAGVDDQMPNIAGSGAPRPNTEWLQLHKSTVQDSNGGVLYSASWSPPTSPSDFYMDVITYDSSTNSNWRIYDNVWGFSSQAWSSTHSVLVVNDNALGQKFAMSRFGPFSGLGNLTPTMFGAESYFTDPSVNLLPNAVYFYGEMFGFRTNPAPPQGTVAGTVPAGVTAFSEPNGIIVVWVGVAGATQYEILRAAGAPLAAQPVFQFLANVPANTFEYDDTSVTITNLPGQQTQYEYEVVALGTVPGTASGATAVTIPDTAQDTGVANKPQTVDMRSIVTDWPFPEIVPNTVPRNGLGIGSYTDQEFADPAHQGLNVVNQGVQYDIWRILSRGPVDAILGNYISQPQSQPAVSDGNTTAKAATVPVGNSCILWIAPYAGRLFEGPGSIDSSAVQTDLGNFVAQGGRLFVDGSAVADALTDGGQVSNGAGSFINATLSAQWASSRGGSWDLTGVKQAAARISWDSYFNDDGNAENAYNGVTALNNDEEGVTTFTYTPPANSNLLLGNNYLLQNANGSFDGFTQVITQVNIWRTDGSLSQLGGAFSVFGTVPNLGQAGPQTIPNTILGRVPTIVPENNAHVDFTYNAPGDVNGDFTGGDGLVYNELPTGGRTVYSAFGLEGLGLEYYDVAGTNRAHYFAHNQRPNVIHNLVEYLRSGTLTGKVLATNGQGAPTPLQGAIVYLTPNPGQAPPKNVRGIYSGTTLSDGSFNIEGVEAGGYIAHAYFPGYADAESNSELLIDADHNPVTTLQLTKLATGSITGTVKDSAGNPVNGASISFTSLDGTVTVTGTSGVGGTYTISNVPATGAPGISYNGTATFNSVTAVSVPNPVAVISTQTSIANFTIQLPNGTVGGLVTNTTTPPGVPFPGVTVTITPVGTGTPTSTTTSNVSTPPIGATGDGNPLNYTDSIPPGQYIISATAPNFTSASTTVTVKSNAFVRADLQISQLPPGSTGTLSGIVTDNAVPPNDISGATVTVTNPSQNNEIVQTVTSASDGSYTVANLSPGTYAVQATDTGFTASATETVTITANTTTTQNLVLIATPPVQSFAAGSWYFFSTPYDYSQVPIISVIGKLNTSTTSTPNNPRSHLFYWVPSLLEYVIDPTPKANAIQLGYGYWVFAFETINISGGLGPLPTTTTIPIALSPGWNSIGVPNLNAVPLSSLTFTMPVQQQGQQPQVLTFTQASSPTFNVVNGTLFGWNGTAYFGVVGSSSSSSVPTALQPWQGYWIFAHLPCTVNIPTGN